MWNDGGCAYGLGLRRLWEGQLFVYSPRRSTVAFVDFARSMIEETFEGRDPRDAQDSMEIQQYADLLGKLKPAFIHHLESKRHLQNIFKDFGCDLARPYFALPKIPSPTTEAYLPPALPFP